MNARIARGVAMAAALTFFEGRLGLAIAVVAFVLSEVAGVSVEWLWGCALGALVLAPVAMIVQMAVSHPGVNTTFATSFAVSRILVETSLALAAYAAVLELTTDPALSGKASPRRRPRPGRRTPVPPHD